MNEAVTTVVPELSRIPASAGTDIGVLGGAVVAGILVFLYILSRFRKDNAANGAEANLYSNLSGEVSRLVDRVTALEQENINLRNENSGLKIRLAELEYLEEDNKRLAAKLERKDAHAEGLVNELLGAHENITQLTERIHQLEMKLQGSVPREECHACPVLVGVPG